MAVIMMPLQASRFGVISSPLILLAALQEHLQIESFSENWSKFLKMSKTNECTAVLQNSVLLPSVYKDRQK